ncbi:MAG: hypothetical protein HUU46_09585 [Candidatus Hydrogenedentes bacterium]|nr:hypothetical protein [Candidatus Hydrogenedentota bacterium]
MGVSGGGTRTRRLVVIVLAGAIASAWVASSVRNGYVGVRVEAEVTDLDPPKLVWGEGAAEFVPMDPIPADSPDAPVAFYDFSLTAKGESDPVVESPSVTLFGIPHHYAGEQSPEGGWQADKRAVVANATGGPVTYRWAHWGPEGLALELGTSPTGGIVVQKTADGEGRINTYREQEGRVALELRPTRLLRAFYARVPRPALSKLRLHMPNTATNGLHRLHVESWQPILIARGDANRDDSQPLTLLVRPEEFAKDSNGAPAGWWVNDRDYVSQSDEPGPGDAVAWTLKPNVNDETRLVKTITGDFAGETIEVLAQIKALESDAFWIAVTWKSGDEFASHGLSFDATDSWLPVRLLTQVPHGIDKDSLNVRLTVSSKAKTPVQVAAVAINHGDMPAPVQWSIPESANASVALTPDILRSDATGDIQIPSPGGIELGGWMTASAAFFAAIVVLSGVFVIGVFVRGLWRRLPDTRLKRTVQTGLANLLLAACSCAFGLLIVEGALRLFYFGTLASIDVRSYVSAQSHPTRGWTLRPNNRARTQYIDYDVLVTTNSRGLRDDEHAYEKPEGVYRIAILGDSYMEAYQVDMADALPGRLERAFAPRNVEVINFGVRGYGTAQEYLTLTEEALRYSPDLALLAYYPLNDLVDNSYELTRQLWGEDVWRTASRPYPTVDAEGNLAIGLLDPLKARRAIELDVAQNLMWRNRLADRGYLMNTATYETYRFIRQAYSLDESSNFDPNIEYGGILEAFSPAMAGAHDLPLERYQLLWEETWKVTARCIEALRDGAEAGGAKFAVFSIPAKVQVDPKFQAALLARFPELRLDVDKPHVQLDTLAKEKEFEHLNLLPVFRQRYSAKGPALYHRYLDTHWNAAGHKLATDAVKEFLEAKGLIPRAKAD